MMLPSTVVVQRARLLARTKLILDLLLAISFFLRDAPWPFLAAVAVDVVLAWPYLRFVQRAPAMATLATLTLTTVLLALAPYALETAGLAAWVLLPLAPLAAAYALSRRRQLWQMAAIATLIVTAAATIALLQVQLPLQVEVIATDPASYLATALAAIAGIWAASWLVSHAFGAESKSQALLGAPLTVVRHVMVAPLRWVVGGVAKDALQQELHDLRRQHAPQWIVLDLGAAGELGRHDLQAVEQAAAAITNPNCSVVLARSPVDALGHMDFAQSLVGRVERFATVPQAVEAGLRRLGWSQNAEQAQRVVTTY